MQSIHTMRNLIMISIIPIMLAACAGTPVKPGTSMYDHYIKNASASDGLNMAMATHLTKTKSSGGTFTGVVAATGSQAAAASGLGVMSAANANLITGMSILSLLVNTANHPVASYDHLFIYMPKSQAKTGEEAAQKLTVLGKQAFIAYWERNGFKYAQVKNPNGKGMLDALVGGKCNTTSYICPFDDVDFDYKSDIEENVRYNGGVELRQAPYFAGSGGAWFFQPTSWFSVHSIVNGDLNYDSGITTPPFKGGADQFSQWAYYYTPHGPNGKPVFYHMGKVYPITAKPDVKQASAN